jgi:hypothetical protein
MNKQEKEYQIQLMAKIYGLANRVVVYLGEAADDSDQALEEYVLLQKMSLRNHRSANKAKKQFSNWLNGNGFDASG